MLNLNYEAHYYVRPLRAFIAKKRDSVKHAEWGKRYETDYERLARDIAFEAGAEIVIRGDEVFIVVDGVEEHLCTSYVPKPEPMHLS